MIEEERVNKCFQFEDFYLVIRKVADELMLSASPIKDMEKVSMVSYSKRLPLNLQAYFISLSHLSSYLCKSPQKIINIDESGLQLVVAYGDKSKTVQIAFVPNYEETIEAFLRRKNLVLFYQRQQYHIWLFRNREQYKDMNYDLLALWTQAHTKYHQELTCFTALKNKVEYLKDKKHHLKKRLHQKEQLYEIISQRAREIVID